MPLLLNLIKLATVDLEERKVLRLVPLFVCARDVFDAVRQRAPRGPFSFAFVHFRTASSRDPCYILIAFASHLFCFQACLLYRYRTVLDLSSSIPDRNRTSAGDDTVQLRQTLLR